MSKELKRKLTRDEIQFVLSEIRPIGGLDPVIAETIFQKIKSKFVEKLQHIMLFPSKLDALKCEITKQYYSTQISPGDSVGIATAQSIGERQTQLALNSFHSTGITTATVVTGVPRFNELVNTTKNPKHVITKIYPKEKCHSISEIRNHSYLLKHVLLKHLIRKTSLYSKPKKLDDWYRNFGSVYSERMKQIEQCTHYIRFECDLQALYTSKIQLKDIISILESRFKDIYYCWSCNDIGILDLWFDENQLTLSEELKTKPYITTENRCEIFMDEVLIPNLFSVTMKGVEGIDQVNFNQHQGEWFIEAMGYNLQKLFAMPSIDNTRTLSNHMWEIYQILGIEATREFLIQEFISVISVDSYINLRHIQLLVDVMLYTGSISSISRYGVHKNQSGALTKCSFEESLDQFLKAGMYGEDEDINGVSGAIICGKVSNIGSGLRDLVYQTD